MNLFALMTSAEQIERIRKLAASGLTDHVIATLTGRSAADVRRALATPVDPPLTGVNSPVFFPTHEGEA